MLLCSANANHRVINHIMAKRKGRITRELIEPLVLSGLSQREIGREIGRGTASVQYWLRVYGLKTSLSNESLLSKRCACGEDRDDRFYGKKRTVCSKCHNKYTSSRGYDTRRKAIEFLGGACIKCGFSEYSSALAFHHINPAVKDLKFSGLRGWRWDRVVEELGKCVLLCLNCHTAYHAGELPINFTRAVG